MVLCAWEAEFRAGCEVGWRWGRGKGERREGSAVGEVLRDRSGMMRKEWRIRSDE